jgi:hypothetical protein
MIHRPHIRVSVWLLAPLLLAQLSLPKVVLCRGEDGHVALEWSHGGQCAPHSQTNGRVELIDRGHCGQCIDSVVSLSDPLNCSQRLVVHAPPSSPTRFMIRGPIHVVAQPRTVGAAYGPAPISPVLLRSVILLI